jgi:hypothetical protein
MICIPPHPPGNERQTLALNPVEALGRFLCQ